MVRILSIPRSGTRFYLYLCLYVLKVEVTYVHFFFKDINKIDAAIDSDDVIIVPVRSDKELVKSFEAFPKWSHRVEDEMISLRDRYMPSLISAGAHFMDIKKSTDTRRQFERLLSSLDIKWTPEVDKFIDEWPVIGSQYFPDDEKSMQVLNDKRIENG